MSGRGDYLVLAQGRGDEACSGACTRLTAEGDWRRAATQGRISIWTRGTGDLPVRALGQAAGFVLGHLHPTPGAATGLSPFGPTPGNLRNPGHVAARLLAAHWGAYVAVLDGPAGAQVFRDPSGQHDCLTWTAREGLGIVASGLADVPGWLQPPRLSLNWDRIAGLLANVGAGAATALLDGLRTVTPGELRPVGGEGAGELVWRPGDFIADVGLDRVAAERALLELVDSCTDAMTRPYDRLVMELSGGLDSSVVSGALAAGGGAGKVVQWLNRVGDRADGDERRFARAVTDRLGVTLTTAEKPLTPLTDADFQELASTVWPALNGVDAARDRDMAQRLQATGARGILSGQGGDAVFYQMPTPWIACEVVRREGPLALASPVLRDLAWRSRKPVWSIYRAARAGLRRDARLPAPVSPLLTQVRQAHGEGLAHPWLAAAADAPLAKQLQIAAIANAFLVRADCRRRRGGDLLFPLLAQPIVELCLAIPAATLAGGVQDRAFARRALASRLPDAVRDRRTKGSLTAYYSRLVAVSREALGALLLDGCLVDAGLLDRDAVAQALDPAQLIWSGSPLEVLNAAAVETWARYWQGRAPDSAQAPRRRR